MTYTQFKNEWNGRRVDYDHIYGYQCVDLIEQYCHELGVNGVYGNAIDYAKTPSPAFKAHFTRVSDHKPGDVLVLTGLAGNPYGHIGVIDHVDKAGVWILEQNGTGTGTGTGKSAIGVYRPIPSSRFAANWRFNGNIAPPKPVPSPYPKSITITVPLLYVRSGPGTNYPLAGSRMLKQGEKVQVNGIVTGQSVSGNNQWYKSMFGNYFWSGGAR